jgi:hypothetical protein
MDNQRPRCGVTKIEMIVILVIAVVVVAVTYPAIRRSRCGAASLKDKTQITQIHKAMLSFANENEDLLPTPGLIQMRRNDSGVLVHDDTLNHSAPLYSYLIGANLVKPELLVSPDCIDETDAVWVKSHYDYAAYNPAANQFWDPTFTMRIDNSKVGANCSYAHMALCGDRRLNKWTNNRDAATPIISTRGTKGGATSGADFDRSPTLKLHLPRNQWVGHICFSDNHSETLDRFYPPLVHFAGPSEGDNIFAAEFRHPLGNQAADDAFLGVFAGSTELSVQAIYDPLD